MDWAERGTRIHAAVNRHLADTASINGVTVRGLFGAEADTALGYIAGNAPTFGFLLSAAPSVVPGQLLVFAGTTYQITRVVPDGTGWAVCHLQDND